MTTPPFKGRVGTLADRPAVGQRIGDQYNATDVGTTFEWNGGAWLPVDGFVEGGIDLSVYSRNFGAAEMQSSASTVTTDGLARLSFPDAATTDAFVSIPLFGTWDGVTIQFDWVNDDAATGDVRWDFELRGNDIGSDISSATVLHSSTVTLTSPGVNDITTSVVASDIAISPGTSGTLMSFRISRLGGDAADTLTGPVGLAEIAFNRAS